MENTHKKNNTEKTKKIIHTIFLTLKFIFDVLDVLKTIIELFQ